MTATIAVAEAVGGLWSNSLALLSDAGHMLTDVSAIGLSLLALLFANRPADTKRTYGYYRAEILSALANGVLLLGITVFIVVEAYQRLQRPEPIQVGTAVVVALIGLLANLAALLFLHRSHSTNVRSALLHVVGDLLSSVAALIGLVVVGATGWTWIDPLLSFGISVVIVWGAFRLVREAVDVLLEAVPRHVNLADVRRLLAEGPGVCAVHDLHVWTLASGVYALSAHLVVQDTRVEATDEVLRVVKQKLREAFSIDHATLQLESESYARQSEVH